MTDPNATTDATADNAAVQAGSGGRPTSPGAAAAAPAPPADSGAAEAAAILDTVDERPLHEHPDAYGRVHAELQRALSAIDNV